MNPENIYDSSHFSWQHTGTFGVSSISRLFGPVWKAPPSDIGVKSARTGTIKIFHLDRTAPGYEDGWDGEYKRYISTDGSIKLQIDLH